MIPALIGAGIGLIGSSMQARAARDAAQTSANAQLEAARIAADAARFRPVGVTTRFGSSRFGFDSQGNLSSADYTVSPELVAIQDRLLSQAGQQGVGATEQALTAQQGLFNLGQQYLAQSPQEAAQQWMQSQQALLQPSRERTLAQTRQNLFNTGREGLAISQGGNLQATNPEMAAYYNALAQQDAQLAAQADEQGRARVSFGAGLFGTGAQVAQAGYSPLQTQLGLGQTIEQLGQGALDIGAQLGGRSATAGANAGSALLQGGLGAARTLQATAGVSPVGSTLMGLANNQQLMSGLGDWMSGLGANRAPVNLDPTGMGLGWGNTDTSMLSAGWRD